MQFEMEDINKPIWQLTVGEFVELIDSRIPKSESQFVVKNVAGSQYVHGLAGLAKILGCSKNHAGKLKSSGIFDEAIIQNGRKIIIDSEKALKLFNENSR